MDPLKYSIRQSAQAKHVRLKVSLYDASLTVVIPRGFDRRRVPEVVREKQQWIERTVRRVTEHRRQMTHLQVRPEEVHLRAVGEEWRVIYRDAIGSEEGVCL